MTWIKLRGVAIDIGSNTTLYLKGEVDADGKISIVEELCFANGLGEDVFSTGRIRPETMVQNLNLLQNLVTESGDAEFIIVAGTSALRKASNSSEFIQAIKSNLGLDLRLLSGEEEAQLTYKGYLSAHPHSPETKLLVDIGGGSTEFILVQNKRLVKTSSRNLGAVKIGSLFPLTDPPDRAIYSSMREFVESELQDLSRDYSGFEALIFSGGTATALASLKLGLDKYDGDAIEGAYLELDWIETIQNELLSLNLAPRRKMLKFDPDRAKVIIEGTLILLSIIRALNFNYAQVTNRGLRFGLLAEKFLK